jgi:hypothetical protein
MSEAGLGSLLTTNLDIGSLFARPSVEEVEKRHAFGELTCKLSRFDMRVPLRTSLVAEGSDHNFGVNFDVWIGFNGLLYGVPDLRCCERSWLID